MASFNKVIIAGNVTRDPQVKHTAGGTAMCEIGLAINESYFDKTTQQKKESVTFVDVQLWGKTAELSGQYLAKGSSVLIEGRLKLDSWEDKDSGQKRSKLRIVGESMQFLGSGKKQDTSEPAEKTEPVQDNAVDEADVPF